MGTGPRCGKRPMRQEESPKQFQPGGESVLCALSAPMNCIKRVADTKIHPKISHSQSVKSSKVDQSIHLFARKLLCRTKYFDTKRGNSICLRLHGHDFLSLLWPPRPLSLLWQPDSNSNSDWGPDNQQLTVDLPELFRSPINANGICGPNSLQFAWNIGETLYAAHVMSSHKYRNEFSAHRMEMGGASGNDQGNGYKTRS